MKLSFLVLIMSVLSFGTMAQLNTGDKVFLTFQNVDGEVNVSGTDAIDMLKSYIVGKTNLVIVDSAEESDYTFILSVVEKNMGNRKGKLDIVLSESKKIIFESKWVKGSMNAFYGYSGSRHAIGKVFKGQILKKYPKIKK